MTLRLIQPIELDGTAPAELGDQVAPVAMDVRPTDLHVDEVYQRGLNRHSRRLIAKIVATWSWARFKAPVCVWVDGKLHVVDGQHTAIAAASHGGIATIPVLVVDAPEEVDRARAFVSHATDKLQATPTQIWQAAVVAGDPDALSIKAAVDAAQVEVLPFPPAGSRYEPHQTIALAAIRRAVQTHGHEGATQALTVCRRAGLGISAELLKVVVELLFGLDYQGTIDAEQIVTTLTTLGPKAYGDARALAAAKRIPVWKALVAVVHRAKRPKPKFAFDPESGKFEGGAEVTVLAPSREAAPLPKPVSRARVIDHRPSGPVTGIICGDPQPGRSALDQRRSAQA